MKFTAAEGMKRMRKSLEVTVDVAVRLALYLGIAMVFFQAPALAQSENAGSQELPAPGVRSGLADGDFVFVGTVESAVAHAAGWSHPPRWRFTIRFGDLDMIVGERPEQMVLGFTTHDDGAEVLEQGARVVVEARNGRIETIRPATEEAVLAAGGNPGGSDSSGAENEEVDLTELAERNNLFALDLYARLKEDGENLFFSPYSISTALAMTYGGARGETREQMARALRFAQNGTALHSAFASLAERMERVQSKGEIELHIANSLWPQKDYPFMEDYISLMKEHYGVSVTPVDYVQAAEEARKAINAWVEEQTAEKIKDLIGRGALDELTCLVLVNAIYFHGAWENLFEEDATQVAPFTAEDGRQAMDVHMMHQRSRFPYAETDMVQVLEMPYAGGDVSMVVVLPRDREGGLGRVETMLEENPGRLEEWLGMLRSREVDVYFPRFQFEWGTHTLVPELRAIGMKDAFEAGRADFSGMDGSRELFVSDVLHKAFVEVNEEGTEAAAATAVVISRQAVSISRPPVFRADHPFLFLIRENTTGSILFIGRVNEPDRAGDA